MKSRKFAWIIAMTSFAALAIPVQLAAQDNQANKHDHYKPIDIGAFPGFSIYNPRVTTNGSTPTGFQRILNNLGTLVGGADTPLENQNNCYNRPNSSCPWRNSAFTRRLNARGR
jgi:hypothetical protein